MENEEEEEVIGEVEAMKSVYESDCIILRSIPPHFHLSLKPRTADVQSHQVFFFFLPPSIIPFHYNSAFYFLFF